VVISPQSIESFYVLVDFGYIHVPTHYCLKVKDKHLDREKLISIDLPVVVSSLCHFIVCVETPSEGYGRKWDLKETSNVEHLKNIDGTFIFTSSRLIDFPLNDIEIDLSFSFL
jgi:hypothetical protein